jgi:hypothetical protein
LARYEKWEIRKEAWGNLASFSVFKRVIKPTINIYTNSKKLQMAKKKDAVVAKRPYTKRSIGETTNPKLSIELVNEPIPARLGIPKFDEEEVKKIVENIKTLKPNRNHLAFHTKYKAALKATIKKEFPDMEIITRYNKQKDLLYVARKA